MFHLILSLLILCAVVWAIRHWKLVFTFLAWVVMLPFRNPGAVPAASDPSPSPSQGRGGPTAQAARPASKRASSNATTGTAYLAAGRRLRSSNSPEQCAAILRQLFEGYRERKYPQLPLLVPAGARWLAAEGTPAISLCGEDQPGNWLLFTLASVPGGTEAGIFGLGDVGQLSVIGHWKMRDSSLTSTGTWPAHTVALTPPPVSDEIVGATVTANGYPATPENLQRMASILFDQFLAKSYTFINGHEGEGAAKRFIAEQRQRADYSSLTGPLRSTLQALAEWNNQVLPYIQDLPLRAHALLLSMARESGNGGVWQDLHR